jgi:hypothetical protein
MSGRDAIRGFVVQATCAVIDSVVRSDWRTMRFEPDEPSQQVDVWWEDAAGLVRRVQVKSSVRPFTAHQVRRWANQLQQSGPGQYEIQLCGPLAGGVAAMSTYGAVRLSRLGHDVDSLAHLAARRLQEILEDLGRYGVPAARQLDAVFRLAGTFLTESVRGKVWTLEQVREEVLRAVQSVSAETELHVICAQNRIIDIHANGDCVETVLMSYFNPHPEAVACPATQVRITDSQVTQVAIFDGLPDALGDAGPLHGSYVVWVPPRGEVAPGAWRHAGAQVRRPAMALVNEALTFQDPVLPPDPHSIETRVWVLLPERWSGRAEAPGAELVRPGLCGWRLFAAPDSHPRIYVRSRARAKPCKLVALFRAIAQWAEYGGMGSLPSWSETLGEDLPLRALEELPR